MTPEDHERERRAFWDACCAAVDVNLNYDALGTAGYCARLADAKLAERDKRWPGPARAPMTRDRHCVNCKHKSAKANKSPCLECFGPPYNEWEPKP